MNLWVWLGLFAAILVVGALINIILIRRVWRSSKRLMGEISTIRRQLKRQ